MAAWRWHRWDGHNNMVPPPRHYDKMFPLGACWGINVLAFEQLLQGLMLKHFTPKCSFADRWRAGPLCRKGKAMLHLCVEVYPGYKGSFQAFCTAATYLCKLRSVHIYVTEPESAYEASAALLFDHRWQVHVVVISKFRKGCVCKYVMASAVLISFFGFHVCSAWR